MLYSRVKHKMSGSFLVWHRSYFTGIVFILIPARLQYSFIRWYPASSFYCVIFCWNWSLFPTLYIILMHLFWTATKSHTSSNVRYPLRDYFCSFSTESFHFLRICRGGISVLLYPHSCCIYCFVTEFNFFVFAGYLKLSVKAQQGPQTDNTYLKLYTVPKGTLFR